VFCVEPETPQSDKLLHSFSSLTLYWQMLRTFTEKPRKLIVPASTNGAPNMTCGGNMIHHISAQNLRHGHAILQITNVSLSVYSKICALETTSCSKGPILSQFESQLLAGHQQAYDRDRRQTRPYFPALYNALTSSFPSFPRPPLPFPSPVKRRSTTNFFCSL